MMRIVYVQTLLDTLSCVIHGHIFNSFIDVFRPLPVNNSLNSRTVMRVYSMKDRTLRLL